MNSPGEVEFTESETPHALYRLYDAAGLLLYVGITWNLPKRMEAHAGDKDWWPQVVRRTMVWYPGEPEARKAEAEAIDSEKPLHNDVRPAIGPAAPPHGQRSGWHRKPFVGWNAPADDAAWIRAHARERGVPLSVALNEMLSWYSLGCATTDSDREAILGIMRGNGIADPPIWWFDDKPETAAWYRGHQSVGYKTGG